MPREQFLRLAELSVKITEQFKELGFTRVKLDLSGFRSGSLNEELGMDKRS
ncbi:hypothetical protein [Desulforamulus profundi]|uniref:hypothetical protein n=1 Tax=Desulforamulus profundi TaxID=1383067 RepID=UPI0030838C0F